MKKNFIFKSMLMIALISMPFVFASCGGDDDEPEAPDNKANSAYVDLTVETTDDLRKIADLDVYFTDMSGNKVDISSEVASNKQYKDSDKKAVKDINFPLELNVVMDITLKSNVADGKYSCGYTITQSAGVMDKNGGVLVSGIAKQSQTWSPSSPVNENFRAKTVTTKITLKKDASGEIIVEK